MKRRKFLQAATAGVVVPTVLNGLPINAYSNPSLLNALLNPGVDTDHALVLIYLGGGNDGLNTLIPIDQYSKYVAARPNVAIDSNALLPLNGQSKIALHPALKGFQTLYNENKMSIVQSVGYPNPDYSHFRSTDIWTSGSDANQVLDTGWLGRYLNTEYPGFPLGYPNTKNPDPLAVQVGGNLPLLFQGPNAQMAMNVSNPDIFGAWPNGIDDPPPNTNFGKELDFIRTIGRQSKSFADAILNAYFKGTNLAQYPTGNYLADTLKVIARVIKGGLKSRLYLVSLYGFDTHSDQVVVGNKTSGVHATLLQYLSEAVLSFQRDLEAMSLDERVLGMTFSEFGRRIKDNMSGANGAGGTDHGAAAPLFLFGKNVQAGIVGSNPFIPNSVNENDNLPMQYDFRSVYTSVLQDWFCVKDPALTDIMLRNYQSLPIVKKSNCTTAIADLDNLNDLLKLETSSNPMTDRVSISISTLDGYAFLQLINPLGTIIKTIFKGKLKTGNYSYDLENENYPPGNYYLRLQQGSAQKTMPLMIMN
ncbi:MAG: DUF1501 domain-containing protein [Saprospiraceae bacterium]|nr:DUF1501 domain-containing protein [Saprospiraceae bacterium]MBK9223057.1 DUF1501 domain-containing protein [Saprospiraceae bacterium]MBK9727576.1 DUF1501 domain-containing protein [Saprospiraceae bacterium]